MILDPEFYAQDTIDVAELLLGKIVVRRHSDGRIQRGRIIETEAYLGFEDPACHSFRGVPTPRTQVMFGPAGHAYVYFIYGVHFCLNVVTRAPGIPEAVLIRALEPLLNDRVSEDPGDIHCARGPGKLCRTLEITRELNGTPLFTPGPIWIEEPESVYQCETVSGPRVGLSAEQDSSYWPLRFGVKQHPCLSGPKFG